MIYTKVEIAPGVELKVDVDPVEMYSSCPVFGSESRINYETLLALEEDWTCSVT